MSKLSIALERAKERQAAAREGRQANAGRAPARRATDAPVSDEALLRAHSLRQVHADRLKQKAAGILTNDAPQATETAYRMLRTRLMHKVRTNGWRVLGITSIGPGEGKTFTAINLAISIAAELGQEAVLVDLDLHHPNVHTYLGIDRSEIPSLSSYFDGNAQSIEDLMVCPGIDRLSCLLSADSLDRPSDLLSSSRGKQLFQELRAKLPSGTVVLVDLPPLLSVDDALSVAPLLDGMLLVVAEGRTKREYLAEAREVLEGFNVVGTLLNMSREKDRRKNRYHYY